VNRLALSAPLLALLAAATGCGKKDQPGGPASIDGTYTLVGGETDLVRLTEDDLKKLPDADRRVVIADNTITAGAGKAQTTSTFQLHPSKNPAEIDLTEKKPDGTTDKYTGIYKLDGDALTICLVRVVADQKETARPTEFRADLRTTLTRYRRQ